MTRMNYDYNDGYLLNRLWNETVSAAQQHILELRAMFKAVGFETVYLEDQGVPTSETKVDIEMILKRLFVQIVGNTKAM